MNRNDDAILAWDNRCQDECEIVANFINAHQSIGATPRVRSGVESRDRLAWAHLTRDWLAQDRLERMAGRCVTGYGRDRIAGP